MDANGTRSGATPILYKLSAASQTLRRPQCGRDIDLTVIFKYRLTGAPYLALGNYAIHAYLIYLTHVP